MRIEKTGWALAIAALAIACSGGDDDLGDEGTANARPMASQAAEDAEGNRVPIVTDVRFRPESPAAGEPIRALVEVEDPDDDPIRLGYVWLVNGETVRANGEMLEAGLTEKGDRVELRVTASDGREQSEPYEFDVRVGNRPPVLKALHMSPGMQITAGPPLVASPVGEDPDGDVIEYEFTWWVNDRGVDADDGTLDTRKLRRGDRVRVRVVAEDGEDRSESLQSGEILVTNAAPMIVSEPGSAGADGVFRYDVEATDADDRRLRYKLSQAPEGMTIDRSSGMIEWTPGAGQAGTHAVLVVVEDLQGGEARQQFELTVGEEAAAPQASPPASPQS